MVKPVVQQGRSEAHGATNKEHHVCARRRVGEAAVSWAEAYAVRYVEGPRDAGDWFHHPGQAGPPGMSTTARIE
jgi:hypothetical protein